MGVPEVLLKGEIDQESYKGDSPEPETDQAAPDVGAVASSPSNAAASASTVAGVDLSCRLFDSTVSSWKANLRGVRLRLGCNTGAHRFGWRKSYYKHGRTKNAIKNGTLHTYYIDTGIEMCPKWARNPGPC